MSLTLVWFAVTILVSFRIHQSAKAPLKKKYVVIPYRKVRVTVAAVIAHLIKTPGTYNYADELTKSRMLRRFTF